MKHAASWILVGILVVVAALPVFASEETTLTGCLGAGEEEGTWVLTTEDDEEVHVEGPAEIGNHEGHKVELSGHWEGSDEEKHFEAASVKHISTECETEG